MDLDEEFILKQLHAGASLCKKINGPVEFSPIYGPHFFEWFAISTKIFYKLLKSRKVSRSIFNKELKVKWYSTNENYRTI